MTFYTYNSGMDFTVPSGKSFNFKTGSFAVTNNSSSTEISLKSRKITLDGSAYDGVTIKGFSPAQITTDTDTKITGRSVYIQPATNQNIYAQGHLLWQPAGFASGTYSPIRVKEVSITFSASNNRATYTLSGLNMYIWTVGGFELPNTYTAAGISSCHIYEQSNGTWLLEVTRDPNGKNFNTTQEYNVTLVGYLRDITKDDR